MANPNEVRAYEIAEEMGSVEYDMSYFRKTLPYGEDDLRFYYLGALLCDLHLKINHMEQEIAQIAKNWVFL